MMHLSQTNTKDFDQLVFNDRNQAYGAYVLRRNYSGNMLKSFLIGIAIIASVLAIPYLAKLMKKEQVVYKSVPYIPPTGPKEIKPDEEKIKPEKQDIQPPVDNTTRLTPPVITTQPVEDTLPTSEDFDKSNPGLSNHQGEPGEWGIPGGCTDCGDQLIGEDKSKKIYPYVSLEIKPEYPGGDDAMRTFLGQNLVYPQHAKDISLQGKVYVTFVIDEFGHITNVDVPREIGGGLDEEAKRVVGMMPRWSPGRQGGHPVPVSFQLPIIFSLD
jgi:protein TonB